VDNPLQNREIFAKGTWKASKTVTVDDAYLDKMMESYVNLNAKVPGYSIPLKTGHTDVKGAPALGYATNVRREGDKIVADFTDVHPAIVDAVGEKRYNAVSVEVVPKIEHAGATYENVLCAVALLGTEWPAVKGLKPLSQFAEAGETVQFTQEQTVVQFTQEQYDAGLAAAKAEFTAQLAALNARADTAEAALAAFSDEAEKNEITAVIEAAEAAGKIVPANKAAVVALAETIRKSIDATARKGALAQFKAFVEGMAPKVDLTEKGIAEQTRAGDGNDAGQKVDLAAKALMSKDAKLSYRDALDQVFATNPDLKTAYAEENR
jgi:hypothetical protein